MADRIDILLPTRNKPEELLRLAREVHATSTHAHLLAYVANDDPRLSEYQAIPQEELERVSIFFGKPLGFSRGINELAGISNMNPNGQPALMLRCEDDFYFQPGWEEAYLSRIPEHKIAMIWCNYVHKGPDAEPQTAAITADWFDVLGYFSLPKITHFYCDNVLGDLAKDIGEAHYIPEPVIIHKWNPSDARKGDHSFNWAGDTAAYKEWLFDGRRQRDAQLLRDARALRMTEDRHDG